MKPATAIRIGLYGSMAAAACAWAPNALADNLGSSVDVGGGQQWTVSNLQPSADAIPYQPAGSLWEATATSQLAAGGVPVIPGFAATSGAQSYPVLWGVASGQGINPSALPAGGSATGKIYFDVTGGAPNSVSYVVDGQPVANWVQPPPPAGGAAPAYTAPRGMTPMPAATAPVAPAAPAATAPAPAAAGSSGTPAPAASGSAGTPLPASGSSGTPLPAEGSTASTAPSAAAATPSTAAAPASTPSTATASPAPASSSPAATPSTAAPATPTTTTTAPR